jgi:hypothetical protein
MRREVVRAKSRAKAVSLKTRLRHAPCRHHHSVPGAVLAAGLSIPFADIFAFVLTLHFCSPSKLHRIINIDVPQSLTASALGKEDFPA